MEFALQRFYLFIDLSRAIILIYNYNFFERLSITVDCTLRFILTSLSHLLILLLTN